MSPSPTPACRRVWPFALLVLASPLVGAFAPARPYALSRWASTTSPRSASAASATELFEAPSSLEAEVLGKLSAVIDPDLGSDIVSLGFVQDMEIDEVAGAVAFSVELTTPACPIKEEFKTQCEQLTLSLPWVQSVEVAMTAQEPRLDSVATGMSQVQNVIAVSSCKGGVGKSTTAVNLAFALQKLGAKVGLMDADIYGPSLPTMVSPDSTDVEFVGDQIRPLEKDGLKLMSFGYINDRTAAMRGPMVMQLINQFVSLTSWGALDYLVIDMPPGTGDVQLTLTQILNITGAVIVTTPQRLSFVDVVKGIDLFDAVNVPAVAVVENMAYLPGKPGLTEEAWPMVEDELAASCALTADEVTTQLRERQLEVSGDASQQRARLMSARLKDAMQQQKPKPQRLFGAGHLQRLSDMWGIENTFAVPLDEEVSAQGDKGAPVMVTEPDGELAETYTKLASSVVQEVARLRFKGGAGNHPKVEFDDSSHMIVINDGEQTIAPADLRKACKCALCVEEITGAPLLDPDSVSDQIKPMDMGPVGNYALAVTWSDMHKSLYPYSSFIDSHARKPSPLDKQ